MPFIRPRTITIQVEGTTSWDVARDPDSGAWIGVCRQLQLNAAGESQEELHEAIFDAMRLFFAELVETGRFQQFILQHGWRVSTSTPVPTQVRNVRVDLPFNLTQRSSVRELATA